MTLLLNKKTFDTVVLIFILTEYAEEVYIKFRRNNQSCDGLFLDVGKGHTEKECLQQENLKQVLTIGK